MGHEINFAVLEDLVPWIQATVPPSPHPSPTRGA